jgi:LysM repeat protein
LIKSISENLNTIALLLIAAVLGAILMQMQNSRQEDPIQAERIILQELTQTAEAAPTETIPPFTPFSSATPTRTLLPPPTFEPPTATRAPSQAPSVTPTATLDLGGSVEGLRGAESPTPVSTSADCERRDDWTLRYTVQYNDALATIAERYNTSIEALAAGNCLEDQNLIREGQILRVPGEAPPSQQEFACVPFEVLTPFNDSQTVAGEGELNFNWRGPDAPRNMLRIIRPDGTVYEQMTELRMNATVDLIDHLPMGGRYTWYVIPLNFDFVQTCPEGGPWTFIKAAEPTPTPTPTEPPTPTPGAPFAVLSPSANVGPAPLAVTFMNQSQGDITGYAWDFDGDGVTDSNDQQGVFVYNVPGTYTARLTVFGPGGSSSNTTTIIVN